MHHTFTSKMDAEVWLAHERALAESDDWTAPKRRVEVAERLAPPTFGEYARQWLADRPLKPRTVEGTSTCCGATSSRSSVSSSWPTSRRPSCAGGGRAWPRSTRRSTPALRAAAGNPVDRGDG
ncbi:hypothetical protein [Ornithinimicrobium sp. INDO-MA30-4]|uniref:hypothetical protein n=1 Tax=Ornithinimicrobium sp. INDO-MA30-4 TaxID=2908651 RepID=UPI001F40DF8F|nr:hypothetical protein [Ornithinimicrobium sp. INDO-MA30-4]UJH69607.1 hypothetical protein L0A91_09590 [Ornithinimicrobium sp. INDO-MA30-4]